MKYTEFIKKISNINVPMAFLKAKGMSEKKTVSG